MKKKIIIAGVTAAILIVGAGIFCISAGNRENDKKTEITQMTETESETETEPITELETTTESVTEVQTEAPTEPQTEQVTEPETESVLVDTSYDDTKDTYSYEEDDDNDDSAPADTQPVYEEPEPVYTEPDYSEPEPVYTEPESVSEDTNSGNIYQDNSQGDTRKILDADDTSDSDMLAENNKDDIQPEDYDKIDWSHRIH